MKDIAITCKYIISNAKKIKKDQVNCLLKERPIFKISVIKSWMRSF